MKTMKTLPEGERTLDQMLRSFHRLLLNVPENQNGETAQPTLTGQRIGGDMYDVLALPWQHRVPTAKDCDTTMNHYNLTMEVIKNSHKDHVRIAEQMRIGDPPSNAAAITLIEFVEPTQAMPTSFLDYIFTCSMCYDMFALLYVSIYSPSEVPKPTPVPAGTGPVTSDSSATKRRSSSSVQNFPSISFDNTNTSMSLDPITPSTSTFLSFYEAAHQDLSMKVNPKSNAVPIRIRKFSRNRKNTYQRPQRHVIQ